MQALARRPRLWGIGALLLAVLVGGLLLAVMGGPLLAIGSVALRMLSWLLTLVLAVLWLVKEVVVFLVGRSWGLWVLGGLVVLGAVGALAAFQAPPAASPSRVGSLEELCHVSPYKVKFATEHDAGQEVARNRDRHDRGLEDYRLERSYVCEFCGWWHNTSQAQPLRAQVGAS